MRKWLVAGIAVALLALIGLSACGTIQNSSSQTQTVAVTLSDSSITASLSTFHPGERCRFVVTNRGAVPHEFLIMPPGMATVMSQTPMAQWHQQAWHTTGMLGPGMMTTFDYTFGAMPMMQPGQYVAFGCYADGHPLMQLPILVRP